MDHEADATSGMNVVACTLRLLPPVAAACDAPGVTSSRLSFVTLYRYATAFASGFALGVVSRVTSRAVSMAKVTCSSYYVIMLSDYKLHFRRL